MDVSFAQKDDPVVIQQIIMRMLMGVNTSIPGTIQEFDEELQLAKVVPNIRAIENNPEGGTTYVQLPDLINVPVYFPYSTTTGFAVTFPVQVGDQCLLVFSQRSIDNWQEYGRVQDPAEANFPRSHSIVDGVAIVGLIPKPNAISNFQLDCIDVRDMGRSHRVSVYEDKIQIFSTSSPPGIPWDAVTPYKEDEIVSIDNGKTFIALEDNVGEPPEGSDKWQPYGYSFFEVNNETILGETGKSNFAVDKEDILLVSDKASLQIVGEDIILKGNVKVDGTLSGADTGVPVVTTAGILHDVKLIDGDHRHSGVEAGGGISGGVQ